MLERLMLLLLAIPLMGDFILIIKFQLRSKLRPLITIRRFRPEEVLETSRRPLRSTFCPRTDGRFCSLLEPAQEGPVDVTGDHEFVTEDPAGSGLSVTGPPVIHSGYLMLIHSGYLMLIRPTRSFDANLKEQRSSRFKFGPGPSGGIRVAQAPTAVPEPRDLHCFIVQMQPVFFAG
jgi:hypothetical protein